MNILGGKKGNFKHEETVYLCSRKDLVSTLWGEMESNLIQLCTHHFCTLQIDPGRKRTMVLSSDSSVLQTRGCFKPTLCGAVALTEFDGQGQKS